MRRSFALHSVTVIASLLLGCGADGSARATSDAPNAATVATKPPPDRFDGERAFALLERQLSYGPRPAGSRQLRRLARNLVKRLPDGRLERVPGHPGLRNIVGETKGKGKPIVIAAHYDTKELPGEFLGANDGAAGTAAVVEIARAARKLRRPEGARPLRFVLFDGEEATDDARPFLETGLRGSTAYAKRHAKKIRSLILLDFVAGKEMKIVRESNSDKELWSELRAAAESAGTSDSFPAGTGEAVIDDHTPFLERGVPAIDLIEWPYGCWHRDCDDLDAVSERSLDATGETVIELVRRLDG